MHRNYSNFRRKTCCATARPNKKRRRIAFCERLNCHFFPILGTSGWLLCFDLGRAEVMPMRVHQLATATLVLVFAAGMIVIANWFVPYRSPAQAASLMPHLDINRPVVAR